MRPAEAAAALDAALRAEPRLRAWRAKRAIGPVEVRVVRPGAFEALQVERLKEGTASPQQLKVSRVLRGMSTRGCWSRRRRLCLLRAW